MSDYRASDSRGRQYFGARPDRMDSARGGKLGAGGMRPAAGKNAVAVVLVAERGVGFY